MGRFNEKSQTAEEILSASYAWTAWRCNTTDEFFAVADDGHAASLEEALTQFSAGWSHYPGETICLRLYRQCRTSFSTVTIRKNYVEEWYGRDGKAIEPSPQEIQSMDGRDYRGFPGIPVGA